MKTIKSDYLTIFTKYFVGFFAGFLLSRFFVDKIALGSYVFTENLTVFFLGIASDVLAATIIALPLTFIRSRLIAFLIMTLVAIGVSGNADHIYVNAANMSIEQLRYAMNTSFLMGSVISWSVLLKAAYILATIWVVSAFSDCSKFKREWAVKSFLSACFMLVICLGIYNIYPVNPLYQNWLQRNFIIGNLVEVAGELTSSSAQAQQKEGVTSKALREDIQNTFYIPDRSGTPILKYPSPDKHPNIIVIAVEGMSHQNLYKGYTPFLDELGSKNLAYENFISTQRVTTNGMYTLWCGDYPNLVSRDTKSEVLERHGEVGQCLPEMLKANGYSTYFMQSASIDYMDKDKLAKAAGIDHIYGAESLPVENASNGWGVSDKDLFDSAGLLLDDLKKANSPFFLTLLNIGTHHPYPNLPQDYIDRFHDYSKAAFFNIDLLIKRFLDKLSEKKLLDNTIVVITSDESAYSNNSRKLPEGYLPNSNGILIVRLPEMIHKMIKSPYSQRDLFFSFSDYLGYPSHAVGRSVFRDYPDFKPQVFSNIFYRQYFLWEKRNLLVTCNYRLDDCFTHEFTGGGLFDKHNIFMSEKASEEQVTKLAAMAAYSDKSYQLNTAVFHRENISLCGTSNIMHKRRFSSKSDYYPEWSIHAHSSARNKDPVTIQIEIHNFVDPRKSYPVVFSDKIAVNPAEKLNYTLTLPQYGDSIFESTISVDASGTDEVVIEKLTIDYAPGVSEKHVSKNIDTIGGDIPDLPTNCES